jgi:hypothetical protein
MISRLYKFSINSFSKMSSFSKSSSSNDNIIDERILSNLKQVYEMMPQNLFSIFLTGGGYLHIIFIVNNHTFVLIIVILIFNI